MPLEAAEIRQHRQNQQQERKCDGEPAPRQCDEAAAAGEDTRSTRDEDEQNRKCTGNHSERQQPAGDQLPCRQGKQKEVQRLAKNRVHHAGGLGRVPKERERRPLNQHAGAGYSGNDERNAERNETQHRLNWQSHRLLADEIV